jgi:arylsulfatase A-like enzyme
LRQGQGTDDDRQRGSAGHCCNFLRLQELFLAASIVFSQLCFNCLTNGSWQEPEMINHNQRCLMLAALFSAQLMSAHAVAQRTAQRPHIVLVMADDQGWGQTGYYQHPVLSTPHLDAMADAGLRFDRFYAGAPVCSPTRASVLTGRTNMRTGVNSHGYPLRLQEKTLAQALRTAGYVTGHFGKWHLNGLRGPGVPVLRTDTHHPGVFGFDTWMSVTNFFDRNPVMSRQGEFVELEGDSSELIVDEALRFIGQQVQRNLPSLSVIWYGTPHSPFMAAEADLKPFMELEKQSRHHYGELVALDRSIGTLRHGLRELGIAEHTILWYCSDNGGLPKITPSTTGGLRGFKGSLYEGGLRVPAIVEWPDGIPDPRVTQYPAVTMDIVPTIADIVGLPAESRLQPQDGVSLLPLFRNELPRRTQSIPFQCLGNTALLDNNLKLIHIGKTDTYELYDLTADPAETTNLLETAAADAERMIKAMQQMQASITRSVAGEDYAERRLLPGDPQPRFWTEVPEYAPWFPQWKLRPEYRSRLKSR